MIQQVQPNATNPMVIPDFDFDFDFFFFRIKLKIFFFKKRLDRILLHKESNLDVIKCELFANEPGNFDFILKILNFNFT